MIDVTGSKVLREAPEGSDEEQGLRTLNFGTLDSKLYALKWG